MPEPHVAPGHGGVSALGIAYVLLGILWVALSTGGGAMLALLAKRIHPALSFRKLWIFYSALLALGAGAFFAIGIL